MSAAQEKVALAFRREPHTDFKPVGELSEAEAKRGVAALRDGLEYEIDGFVLKLGDRAAQRRLGTRHRTTRSSCRTRVRRAARRRRASSSTPGWRRKSPTCMRWTGICWRHCKDSVQLRPAICSRRSGPPESPPWSDSSTDPAFGTSAIGSSKRSAVRVVSAVMS